MAKKFIKGAIGDDKGVFAAKAKAAGKTTKEYADEHKGSPGTLGKQARLAITLMGMNHGKKKVEKKPSMASRLYGDE